jgi:catechol 2,3-dioxygenase-like lactoylglutathione lyase family enzyme
MELHRGRLVDHIQLVTRDLASSRPFYDAILGVLGIPIGGEGDGYAAFLLDPDGNNIEVVHHGAGERSADSVAITVGAIEEQE